MKVGRPAAKVSAKAAEMQVCAIQAVDSLGLKYRDIAARIGRSPSAVAAALTTQPATESPTLKSIFNEFCVPSTGGALETHARQLAARSPQTAQLLAALLTDLAGLLVKPQKD